MRTTRALAALSLLCAAPGAALGGELDAVGHYNDTLVAIAEEVNDRIRDANEKFAYLEVGPRFDAWRTTSLDALALGLGQLDALPARDDDAGFRAAVRDGLGTAQRVIGQNVSEGFALSTKEDVTNADLARFEAIYAEAEDEAGRVDEAISRAQRDFARAFRMRLVDRRQAEHEDELPNFTAPGIPPKQSRLPGQIHVGFAVRYGNALVAAQNELSRAAAEVVQAEERALERTRRASLKSVRAVRERLEAAEAWQGDDTLRAGALAMARTLEESLAGAVAEYAKLARRDDLDAREVDRANELIAQMNEANRSAHGAFADADAAFRARWAVDAYQAWSSAREADERARGERRARRERRTESI